MRCPICVRHACICNPGDHTNAMRREAAQIAAAGHWPASAPAEVQLRERIARIIESRCPEILDQMLAKADTPEKRAYLFRNWMGSDVLAKADAIIAALSLDDLITFQTSLAFLREDEGDSVTLLGDNPDGPPNNAIECSGEWTNWQDRRFEGETLEVAIAKAVEAKRRTVHPSGLSGAVKS